MSQQPITKSYWIQLLFPINGTPSSLTTTKNNATYPTLIVPSGKIFDLRPVFPSGSNGLVFVKMQIGGNDVFPSASNLPGNYINLNDTPQILIPFTFKVDISEETVDLVGYNTDTVYPHTITFGIDMVV